MFDFEDVRCRCSPSGSKALGSVSIPVEMGDGEKKRHREEGQRGQVQRLTWQTNKPHSLLWHSGKRGAGRPM